MASTGTTISTGGGAADRYAAALYDFADEHHALDQTVGEMQSLRQMIDQTADLRRLLASPLIDIAQAQAAMRTVLEREGFGKTIQDFVGVVVTNRRLAALSDIVNAFAALVDRKRGIVSARVATAHPLSDVQRQLLRARLIEAGYGQVNIIETVDASLLGGLIVTIGARIYDTSLKSRLQRLQYAMKGAA